MNIETIINKKLEQFTKLGRVAKKIKNNRRHKLLRENIHIGMTRIALDLELVKDVIFEQHPNLRPLFEGLIELYGPTIKE